MFNYENSAAKDGDKAWFDGIAAEGALQLVQYDQYKKVLNDHLTYTKGTTEHGGTVGALTIPFNQENFSSNGRYYVRVASTVEGKTSYALVPIHVVKHDAPTFAVQEIPASGRNLHFSVQNMVYGIVDPVEEVTLTKPDKTTLTLNKIDDYYLISQNLFVLYNDTTAMNGENHLDQKGTYVLTVKATGFQDAVCKFCVNDGEEVETPAAKAMRSYGIDVLSGSTTSIGTGDSSSGGGYAISADLLFDSDLLANALVLKQVGEETSAASTVLDYWESNSVHDAVFNTGDTKYYPIGAYISAVNTAQTKGTKWLPFDSYRGTAKATANQPHATKAVLEDGLLGDIQDSSTSGKLDAITPIITGNAQGSDVVLTFTGDKAMDYLTNIKTDGLVYLNGDWRELGTDKYTVDLESKTITFQAKCFAVGKNSIRLKSAGYTVQDVTFEYSKVNETVTDLTVTQENDVVHISVNGSDGDFLKNLNAITLGERNVWPKGVSSADDVYYVVAKDYKSVDLYNVTTPGQYTVNIKANYYDEAGLSAEFTVAGEEQKLPVPNTNPTVTIENKNYLLTFGSTRDIKNWNSAVNSVTVNGVTYTKFDNYFGNISEGQYKIESDIGGQGVVGILLHNSQFTKGTDNEIVIKATGYEDLTLSVNKDGTVPGDVTAKEPPMNWTVELDYWNDYTLKAGMGHSEFMKNISTVIVNEMTYEYGYVNNNTKYSISSTTDGIIKLGKENMTSPPNVVVIKATGYKDLTLTIAADKTVTATVGDSSGSGSTETPETPSEEGKEVPSYVGWNSYQLIFDQGGSNAEAATYLTKISKITIKNTTGETVLTESSSGWSLDATQYYKLNSGSDKYISFSPSAFSKTGDNIITIQADGYKNLTLTITNGNLKTDN